MITTLTPSPSIDLHYQLPELEIGKVNRAQKLIVQAGGKGFNVSKILTKMGVKNTAVIPLSENEEKFFSDSARFEGMDLISVPISSPIRLNASLVVRGETTKVNAASAPWTKVEAQRVAKKFYWQARRSDFAVIGGSLPIEVPASWLVGLVRDIGKKTKVVIDCSGSMLKNAILAEPYLIKPNREEAEELLGHAILGEKDAFAACFEMHKLGAKNILLSLGQDGVVFCDGKNLWRGYSKKVEVVNTVGAGDTLLAGFLGGFKRGIHFALANGLAWSEAILQFGSENLDAERIQPDLSQVVSIEASGIHV